MAKQNYNECLNRLLKDEGGYTNHPDDKGGPTNYGITIADYRKYVKADATALDVKNMRLEEAKSIYKKRYWDAIDADNLPSGIDYLWFDYGVNSGVGRVRKIKPRFENIKDTKAYINAVCDERLAFMKSIRGGKDWQVFGKGWSNRVAGVRKRCLELAKQKSVAQESAKATGILASIGAGLYAVYTWGATHSNELLIGGTAMAVGVGLFFLIKSYRKTIDLDK